MDKQLVCGSGVGRVPPATDRLPISEAMLDRAVEAYRPFAREDRRTTREAMRDALVAALDGEGE